MWHLIQFSVFFAVVASNIHWHWTPNGYLAALCGGVAAFLVTVSVNGTVLLLRRLRGRQLRPEFGAGESRDGHLLRRGPRDTAGH